MENVVQKESKLRRVVQTGKDKNRPDTTEYNDSVAALKLQLNEAVFLGRFMGAISSTLDPADICSIASRWLYDYLPYLRIVFNLSQDFCMETLAFSPGGAKTSEVDQSKGYPLVELRSEECKNTLSMGLPCLFDGGVRCRRYSMELSNAMGTIVIFFEEMMVARFSPSFLTSVAENFSHALKNALEHNKVKELAMRDGLTGLFNRRVFDEMVTIEVKRQELMPLSLLMIDIDNFKVVNDRFGHPSGDQVLAKFGKILRDNCRGSDIVARYGGEEFAVLLPSTRSSIAFDISQRLRNRLAETIFVFDGHIHRLTASIGIAHTSDSSKTAGDLVKRADRALYRAKRSGKNRTCVYAPKTVDIVEKKPERKRTCCSHLQAE